MLRITVLWLFLLVGFMPASGQPDDHFVGSWVGKIQSDKSTFRFVLTFKKHNSTVTCTIDSPDQGAKNLPTKSVDIHNGNVAVDASNLGAQYRGIMQPGDTSINGEWLQDGSSYALDLTKVAEEVKPYRPQEPVPPFPYAKIPLKIENSIDGVILNGILTLPKGGGAYPAVLLLSGVGPKNLDDEIMGHRPFAVIADYLARNGIASLRFDKRGSGSSTGNYSQATTADFARDAVSAFKVLLRNPKINKRKVGVMGRDEGGVVAAMVASEDSRVAFVILLGAIGVSGEEMLLSQARLEATAAGVNEGSIKEAEVLNRQLYDIVIGNKDNSAASSLLVNKAWEIANAQPSLTMEERKSVVEGISSSFPALLSPWYRSFLELNPSEFYSKIKVPVLALNGSLDLMISANNNLLAIENSLKEGKNANFKILKMDGLNHLFQRSIKGLPSEYGVIEETISPDVLRIIKDWIKNDVAPLPVNVK